MIDNHTRQTLHQLSDILNDNLDILIRKRENAAPQDKYLYRYICKKLEIAIGSVNKVLDKAIASV